ncbi:hypothetical protein Z946_2941 [Sulfitobacter noctilucicola]|nr:hypothetical protein Z946_2941 [Sulfitobacter noctilucicola]
MRGGVAGNYALVKSKTQQKTLTPEGIRVVALTTVGTAVIR